jgi:L-2-hydroxyglutarate oxidase LhgO
VEKEPGPGRHASGRNSGVLHAGFYYSPDSLKARLTRDGNRRMQAFCRERGLGLRPCGKLVVARDEAEDRVLDTLLERGQANGVELHTLTLAGARAIEPRVRSWWRALFSPTTASVDPAEVVGALAADARERGVEIWYDTRYLARGPDGVVTSRGPVQGSHVINAAGLYADRVAHDFGFGLDYRVLPFKGLYLVARPDAPPLRVHVYPVPDLRNPFLGVHLTVSVRGEVTLGPTAIPALWPEQYRGLAGLSARDLFTTSIGHLQLMASGDGTFYRLAWEELRKYSRPFLVHRADGLVDGLDARDFPSWGPAGIRAQLYHRPTRKLEMDFVVEGDGQSTHVLNAVSPAFTCSLPFAEYVVDRITGPRG